MYIQKIFQDYKVFLDDTALADENSYVFLESVKDISQNVNIQFIVPLIVIKKIEQISSSSDRYEADCAKKAKYRLKTMQSQGILQVRGEKSDKDIVNTFVSVFAKFKKINRLALITHDITLAEQISTLNNLSGFEIAHMPSSFYISPGFKARRASHCARAARTPLRSQPPHSMNQRRGTWGS